MQSWRDNQKGAAVGHAPAIRTHSPNAGAWQFDWLALIRMGTCVGGLRWLSIYRANLDAIHGTCSDIYAYRPRAMPGGDARSRMNLAFIARVFLMGGEFLKTLRKVNRSMDAR
jgi:hypothetical protein